MILIDASWCDFVLCSKVCRKADHFAHHPAGPHDARASKSDVSSADISSGNEEVLDIFGIKTAVRERLRRHINVFSACKKLLSFEIFAVLRIRKMEVYCPGSCYGTVRVKLALLNIHLV